MKAMNDHIFDMNHHIYAMLGKINDTIYKKDKK